MFRNRIKNFLLYLIRRYQETGGGMRWFGIDCNFQPSCSAYTYQAIERFGIKRGCILGFERICRCSAKDSFCKCIESVPESIAGVKSR